MSIAIKQKLSQLIANCQTFQKSGKYAECIEIMEEVLLIKKNVYGSEHKEFKKSTQKLCEYLNLAAMIYLQQEKFDLSIDLLKKAELISQNSLEYKSITFNNLGCYYRRLGKLKTALSYLVEALDLQLRLEKPTTLADTHLNLCAVLSQLDRHQDALQHSMLSIILLQDEFLKITLQKYKKQSQSDKENIINDERLAVLAIAYHNMGVQFEHMKRFEQALNIYNKALKFSKQYLIENVELISNLTKVVKSANQQLNQAKRNTYFHNKKQTERDSLEKKDIYREFLKPKDRYKNLPRLDEIAQIQEKSHKFKEVENSRIINSKQSNFDKSFMKNSEKNFITKRQPKIYKSKSKPIPQTNRDYESTKQIGVAKQIYQNRHTDSFFS